MIFGLLLAATVASSTPCTAVNPDCTEWIMPAGQPSRLLIYRNYSALSKVFPAKTLKFDDLLDAAKTITPSPEIKDR